MTDELTTHIRNVQALVEMSFRPYLQAQGVLERLGKAQEGVINLSRWVSTASLPEKGHRHLAEAGWHVSQALKALQDAYSVTRDTMGHLPKQVKFAECLSGSYVVLANNHLEVAKNLVKVATP